MRWRSASSRFKGNSWDTILDLWKFWRVCRCMIRLTKVTSFSQCFWHRTKICPTCSPGPFFSDRTFDGLEGLEGFGRKVHSGYSFNMFYCFLVFIFHFQGSRLAGYEPIGATMTKRYWKNQPFCCQSWRLHPLVHWSCKTIVRSSRFWPRFRAGRYNVNFVNW